MVVLLILKDAARMSCSYGLGVFDSSFHFLKASLLFLDFRVLFLFVVLYFFCCNLFFFLQYVFLLGFSLVCHLAHSS